MLFCIDLNYLKCPSLLAYGIKDRKGTSTRVVLRRPEDLGLNNSAHCPSELIIQDLPPTIISWHMNTPWHSSQPPSGSCFFRSFLPAALTLESDLLQGTWENLLPQTFALWGSLVLYKHSVVSCLFHDISQHSAGALGAKVFSRSTQHEIFLGVWPTGMQSFMLPQEDEHRHNFYEAECTEWRNWRFRYWLWLFCRNKTKICFPFALNSHQNNVCPLRYVRLYLYSQRETTYSCADALFMTIYYL